MNKNFGLRMGDFGFKLRCRICPPLNGFLIMVFFGFMRVNNLNLITCKFVL
jgi:hypothetical protein